MTVRVFAPEGAVGAPRVQRAPALPVLAGLRIGVLDNEKPNARLLMVRVAERLASRTGAIVALVTDKGPGANAATPCTGETIERIGKEVDLVLTGSAD
jgi:hypothetical protein